MKRIIHSASEEAPYNELLLIIYAKKGYIYNHASTCIVKGEIGWKFIPANVASKDRDILPVAWCLASDVYKLIGFDKEDKDTLFEMAKRQAWPWYNEEEIKRKEQNYEEDVSCKKTEWNTSSWHRWLCGKRRWYMDI